jgi:Tfp pilus assembly protein PilF
VRAYGRNFTLPGVSRDSTVHLAVSAVDRALAADSNAVEAWVAEALVSRILDPTNAGPTLKAIRRALALDSTSGTAWHWYAITLADGGDLSAAHRAWHAGALRAPGYAEGLTFLGLSEYWRGQYDSAQYWVDSAVAVDPNYGLARSTAGYVAIERGDFGRGAASFEAARRLGDGIEAVNALAGSALVAARSGRRDEARALLRSVDSMAAGYSPTPLHTAVYIAQAHVGLGESAQAIAWLGRYEPRADLHFQLHLRCDPGFAAIESDPHFTALLLPMRPRPDGGCRGD